MKTAAGCPAAASSASRRLRETPDYMTLDEVDVSREIGGDFHANGLLANLRLVPDLHEISSNKGDYLHPPDDPAEDHPLVRALLSALTSQRIGDNLSSSSAVQSFTSRG